MQKSPPPAQYKVPALEKGLDILELLAASSMPMSLTEISRAVGRKVSEMQRMVGYLHARGYLVRDSLGGYRISSRLFRLAHIHPPFQNLLGRALPHMETFAAKARESIHLSIFEEYESLILGQAVNHGDPVSLSVPVGSRAHAEETVAGRLMLAGLSPEAFASFVTLKKIKGQALTALQGRLERIRKDGFDGGPCEQAEGIHHLGVAVRAAGAMPVAAITCAYLSSKAAKPAHAEALLAALRETALAIGNELEPVQLGIGSKK